MLSVIYAELSVYLIVVLSVVMLSVVSLALC
jgi:hypothetical protein